MLKITRLPVPVIVVGNVVVGGAGKTPTVLALLQHLQQRGWHPGVVSRGHGRRGTGVLEVQPDTPATESGDEPALIRRSGGVPVFVAARRADAAQALLAAHPRLIERPVLELADRAAIGRPPEALDPLLKMGSDVIND